MFYWSKLARRDIMYQVQEVPWSELFVEIGVELSFSISEEKSSTSLFKLEYII
jgi:hypothetical protein